MKKIFTLIALFALAFSANAQEYTKLDTSVANALYIEGTVSIGKSYLNVYMKNDQVCGGVDFQFFLPEGFELDSEKPTSIMGNYDIFPNQPDGSIKNSISGFDAPESAEPVLFARIPVVVTATPGTYPINAIQYQMVDPNADGISKVNYVYTEVTVQRAASINVMDANNFIEIRPFEIIPNTTENEVQLLMTNNNTIGNVEFDIYLPEGITWSLDGEDPMEAELDNYNAAPNQNIEENEDGSIHVQFYRSASKYYFNAGLEAEPIATIYLDAASSLEPGVYSVMIKNITLEEKTEGESYSGEYYFSVFVGKSSGDAILYGNYDEDAKAIALSALVGGSADITSANIEGNFAPNDVLVYGKTNTTFSRTVASGNWGTVCLPYELKSDEKVTYYTIAAVNENSITLDEVATVEANVPAIFKASGAVLETSAAGYNFASAVENATATEWTIKGTYSNTEVAAADGTYYLSNNKVVHANQNFPVKAFRAWFEGAAGAKVYNLTDGSATDIQFVENGNGTVTVVFDVQGRQLAAPQKGQINIVNGKKFIK